MNELERIKIFINHLIICGFVESQKDLGEKIGYKNESYFSQIINGKVKQPKNFINDLKSFFDDLNVEWITEGKGNMLISESNDEEHQESVGETITMSREAWQTIVSQQETIRSQQEDLSRLIAAMLGKTDEQPKKAAASS